MSKAVTLTNNLPMTDSLSCLSFFNGMTATSADHYQLNLSCSVTATTTATLVATVHSDTKITILTVYLLVWDNTFLFIAALYFVDSAICRSLYGVQQNYFTLPYNYIDTSYIGGLGSFSTRDNYEFNISLSNRNFTTSTSSYYDDVPQFMMRVRNCTAPYSFFDKVDLLCYVGCPNTTYPVQIYQTC